MKRWPSPWLLIIVVASCVWPAPTNAQNVRTIRQFAIRESRTGLQIEIAASAPVASQTQVLSNPDRIVIDFPDSVPAHSLRAVPVNRGHVTKIRVSQFSANPPVTRVVLDLQSPQPYQLSSTDNSVWVKLGTGPTASQSASATLVRAPTPRFQVSFFRGMLRLHAERASLAEILSEIQRKTGAEIDFPPDAAQEKVVTDLGPAPARDVLAALLDGSRFNFVMMGSERDPNGVQSLFLTPRTGGESQPTGSVAPAPSAPPQQQAYSPPPPLPEDAPPAVELPEQEDAQPPAPPDTAK